MKDKVYIAGKITGDPNYRAKFAKAEEELRSKGYTLIMNPAVLPEGFKWDVYMRITVTMLHACNTIYLLEDWEDSEGAKIEAKMAREEKYTILYQKPPKNPQNGAENTK